VSRKSEELLDFAKRNGVLDDPEVRRLVLAAGVSSNESLQKAASKAVLGKSIQHFQYPFRPQLSSGGDLELGRVFDGGLFRLDEGDLNRHLLAVGQSGSGKTTLFYSLYEELDRPVWFLI